MAGVQRPPGVELRGQTRDPLGVLRDADLVVIPSWVETGPYTACEAMSLGVPFVGTATGDMPEFLSSGCGWLTPPRDQPALREVLGTALSSERRVLEEMGAKGRSWLTLHRPFARWAECIERIYTW
jgi:glycosyltransferase involved in cell wall biosynthesis